MTSKERLQEYINKDEIYLNFQKGNKISSDFDMFCIRHCEDIRTILAQYETLKSKFEAVLEENKKANDIIDNNLELIKKLEQEIKNKKFLLLEQGKELKEIYKENEKYESIIIPKTIVEINELEEKLYQDKEDYMWIIDELEGIKNVLRGEEND